VGKITELYDQRAAFSAELSALRSSFESADEPSEEQVASISNLRGKVDSVTAQIHKIEATRKQLEDMQASIDATAPRVGSAHIDAPTASYSPLSIPRTVASKIERDARTRMSGLASRVYKGDASLATIGAQFIGALRGEQSCIDAVQASYHEFEATQNTQQNSAGGFLVPDDLVPSLIDLREQYGVIRRTATVMNVTAPAGSIPRRTSRPSATFVGEPRLADVAAQDMAFDSIKYAVKPIMSITEASIEMEQDSLINISALVFMHAAEDFAYTEDNCAFNGTGTSAFGGIVGILPTLANALYAGSVIETTGATTLATITAGMLTNVAGAIPQYADIGASWFVSRAINGAVIDRIKQAAGGNTVQLIEGRMVRQYNGYPVEISQVLPTTAATGEVVGVYGNMGMAAHLFSKGGILMDRSADAEFKKGHIVYRTIQRFDFVFHERGSATAAGPLVVFDLD